MLDTLKTLCYLSGVSSCEDEVRDYVLERVMGHADEISTDIMGNVVVFKRGRVTPQRRIMLCAHMDEVGLIITHIGNDGYLRFGFVGGIDRRVIPGRRVFIGHDRVPGIIGIKAYHQVIRNNEKEMPKSDAMYIDIGAADDTEASADVILGDIVVFDDNIMEFGDGFLKAKALDDRVGCAVMIELIERELPCDCWFVFTAQEEVGTRGAMIAANNIQPEIALILEGTTAADLPGVDNGGHICRLGDGVVIPFMDKGAIYDRELYLLLCDLADKNGIKRQTKSRIAGATDGGAIQISGAGVKVAALAAPLRNIHTPACVGKISDILPMPELAFSFLETISDEW